LKPRATVKLAAAALLPLLAATPLGAQRSAKPFVAGEVRPEAARDDKLEAAIKDPDGDGRPDNHDPEGELWTRYYYNRVDLDGDGRPEVLVYLFGPYMCGSGGCNTLVFRREGDAYRLVSDIPLTRNPVVVSEHRTNGWNDLIYLASGGGVRAHYVVLRFDGKTYPEGNSDDPGAAPLKAPARGKAYLVGSGEKETGFAL
jgi:hypothetical protein